MHLSFKVSAQKEQVLNLPKYDLKAAHFGFLLAYNKIDFSIRNNANMYQFDTLYSITSKGEGGFGLGIVSNFRLGDYLDFRFLPTLSFCQRNLYYTFYDKRKNTTYDVKKPVESTLLEAPLLFKYKSARLNNMRAYIIGGGKYSYDLASYRRSKKDGAANDFIKLNPHVFSGQLGVGFDFYTTYFKFSPEVSYSMSFNNVKVDDNNIYHQSINKMYSKMWQVTLYFE